MDSMVHRLAASFVARSKNLKMRLWRLSSHARTFRSLQGRYVDKRCFIIGNGPSLCAEDLDRLTGEYAFGFNRIYKIFDQTSWRPTFYCSEDSKMLGNCLDEVSQLDLKYKFIPYQLALWCGMKVRGATYFLVNQKALVPDEHHFSPSANAGFSTGNTIAYTAMQMAVYMGFTEIYLIGIDHSFSTSVNDAGEIMHDPKAKDYFCDDYNEDKDELYIPNPNLSTIAYLAARAYADKHGIRILNATRGGKLEVFPRVEFDALLQEHA
jgi:hypothetical protein